MDKVTSSDPRLPKKNTPLVSAALAGLSVLGFILSLVLGRSKASAPATPRKWTGFWIGVPVLSNAVIILLIVWDQLREDRRTPIETPVVAKAGDKLQPASNFTGADATTAASQKAEQSLRVQPGPLAPPRTSPSVVISVAVLAIAIILTALGVFILNVGPWFDTFPFLSSDLVEKLNCIVPAFCALQYPPMGIFGFIALLIASGLFGILIYRLPSDPPSSIQSVGQVNLVSIRQFFMKGRWVIVLLGIASNAYVLNLAISQQPISGWWWGFGLSWLLLAVFALAVTPTREWAELFWMAIYLGGLTALLVGVGGILANQWWPTVTGLALALVGLGPLFVRHWPVWSTPQRVERVLIPLVTVAALLLMSNGMRAWYWVSGDQDASPWDYYERAYHYATGALPWPNVNSAGVYGGTGAVSSALQATGMMVFGADAVGWRLSNFVLLALCTPALYYFARQFMDRPGALLSAGLYASSHFLLSYSKTGFHTLQIIAVFAFMMAALAWATRRGSLPAYAMAGLILGIGFYTYGVARIYFWAAALWLLLFCFPFDLRMRRMYWDRWAAWGAFSVAAIIAAVPILADPSGLQQQVNRTVFLQSDIAHNALEGVQQFLMNVLYAATAFLSSHANHDFVFGAHTDPLSGGLIVVAWIGLIVGVIRRSKASLFLIGLSGGLIFFLGGLETYAYPNNNWLFALVPIYALLAALGFTYAGVLGRMVFERHPSGGEFGRLGLGWVGIVGVAAVIGGLNFWISNNLGPSHLAQAPQNIVVQSAQQTSDKASQVARVFAVIDTGNQTLYQTDELKPLLPLIMQAYDLPPDRFQQLSPEAAFRDQPFCNESAGPTVVVMDAGAKNAARLADEIQQCWPNSSGQIIRDVTGAKLFYRFRNGEAQARVRPLAGYWTEEPVPSNQANIISAASRGLWQIGEPMGLAIGPNNEVAVIEGTTESVIIFDVTGHAIQSISGLFVYPAGLGFTNDKSQMLVLDAGASTPLVWLDGKYKVVQDNGGFSSPRGMFVAADNSVYVADTAGQRVVHLDATGTLLQTFQDLTQYPQPTSVAVSPKGWIAVGDPASGKISILNPTGVIQYQFDIGGGNTTSDKPGLLWLTDEKLLYTDPGGNRLVLVQGQKVLKEWTDLGHPTGLAINGAGQLLVLEFSKNQVKLLELPK